MSDNFFFDVQLKEFEELFQAFVMQGGLDSTHIINEDYERAHISTLCKHNKRYKDCDLCYRPPLPSFSF
jgi:hypothetical protein